ncbi:virulence-associated E family protein [uncultured Sulfitobacter sp.]|uniref:virulence-associated E family protein n=1 Tax=uncultured Sulfitobacter sp. TaxID=191468 RepID=UPI0030D8295E
MTNDNHILKISHGSAKNRGLVKNIDMAWSDFVSRMSQPVVDASHTAASYAAKTKEERGKIKSQAGFMFGGECADGVRRKSAVQSRTMITLDADDLIDDELYTQLKMGTFEDLEFEAFVHTTRSHAPDHPRFRIMIPLTRGLTDPEEYEAVARLVAERMDPTMECWDLCSWRCAQMMYKPSISSDQEFIGKRMPGEICDPDIVLEECEGDWRDITLLPRSETEKKKVSQAMMRAVRSVTSGTGRLSDPAGKQNIVGAFCSAYDIWTAIDTLLADVYVPSTGDGAAPDRFSFAAGSGFNGVTVLNGTHLYSHHATDPAGNMALNAWDAVRIHKFGHLDIDEVDFSQPAQLESHKAMTDFALNDPKVKEALDDARLPAGSFLNDDPIETPEAEVSALDELLAEGKPDTEEKEDDLHDQIDAFLADDEETPKASHEAAEEAPEVAPEPPKNGAGMFAAMGAARAASKSDDADDTNEEVEDQDWMADLDRDKKGNPVKSLYNFNLVAQNDPRIGRAFALNEFTLRICQIDHLRSGVANVPHLMLKDVNDRPAVGDLHIDVLRSIMSAPAERNGYSLGATEADIMSTIRMLGEGRNFHPVKDFIESHEWDGDERIETLFVDFLGAEDNAFNREASRKFMAAAVARIYEPGCKFDHMVIIEGSQDIGKSTFVDILAGNWFAELIDEDMVDVKKSIEKMSGAWILEVPELAAMEGRNPKRLKTFLSARTDKARMSYDRFVTEVGRQAIFVGTVDSREYLNDPAGNRRYWPVICGGKQVDFDGLRDVVPQLWAEALVAYNEMREKAGKGALPLWLENEDAREIAKSLQKSRVITDPVATWKEDIEDAIGKVYEMGQVDRDGNGFDAEIHERAMMADGMEGYRLKRFSAQYAYNVILGFDAEGWSDRKTQALLANVLSHVKGIRKGVTPQRMNLPTGSGGEAKYGRYYEVV